MLRQLTLEVVSNWVLLSIYDTRANHITPFQTADNLGGGEIDQSDFDNAEGGFAINHDEDCILTRSQFA